jgi:hypothetical protein
MSQSRPTLWNLLPAAHHVRLINRLAQLVQHQLQNQRRDRRLFVGGLPICGVKSGSCPHERRSGGVSLVQLSVACWNLESIRLVGYRPCFEGLGNCDDERAMRYREFVQSAIPAGEWALIREALQRGQLTGTERFCDEIEAIIGRRIENRKQGRPRKDTQILIL